VKGGLLIRQMHHWAALIFVAAVALHMARVYFTGAFRRPREPNWVIGAILLVLALAAGFTGYSLPDDLLSGTGLRITYSIILAIPFVGERVWPGFAMKSVGLLLLTAGVATAMGALLEVNPVWLYGPYEPGAATSYAQPDWYIGFLEGSLRLMPPWEIRVGGFVINNLVFAGMLVPGVLFGAVFVVPWIERRVTRDQREHHLLDRPREAPRRTASGAAGLTFVTVLFIGGAQDVVAGTLDTGVGHVTTVLQIASIVAPVVAWVVTWRVCLALQRRPRPERTERSVVVRRAPSGAYEAIHDRDAGHDGELAAGTARAATIDEVTGR
jgi:ubiquinol-cytochrome c reductase cytochrome b subunit